MKRFVRQEVFGMARIGWVPVGTENTVEVYVNTDDPGKTPHFHVRKYSNDHKFEWETCIRFDSADYFLHGKYKDKLPRKEAKKLDKMLRTKNPKSRHGDTYWQSAVDSWNINNSDIELPFDIEQPDYTKLG